MPSAKDITVKPISAADAKRVVQAVHYSGKAAINAHLNLGVFLNNRLEGVLQFGPPLQKSAVIGLVENTSWSGFIELNRMAFSEALPRNSESRALAVAFRLIRKQYPHIQWVLSFADGAQCGDGTIYRASGFVLTGVKVNSTLYKLPDGFVFADVGLRASSSLLRQRVGYKIGEPFSVFAKRVGAQRIPGFQLRYIYFLDPTARERLTVPILPFSKIEELGAGMYRGKARPKQATESDQLSSGGATPTRTLQTPPAEETEHAC